MKVTGKQPKVNHIVTIKLTEEEAMALFATLGAVGGNCLKNNPREFTDPIWNALDSEFGWFSANGEYVPGVEKFNKNIRGIIEIKSP